MTGNLELQRILFLIEESNVEFDVLFSEFNRNAGHIRLDEYIHIRSGIVAPDHLRRLHVLQRRGWVRIADNGNIVPLRRTLVGQEIHLNDDDIAFGRPLLDEFGNVDNSVI